MILYFSATGNTRYGAELLQGILKEETPVSMNELLRKGTRGSFYSESPYVIAAPIHAWRLPRQVEKLILDAEFKGNRNVYFVATMGMNAGNCKAYCERLCRKKGLVYKGFCGVVMPDNYLVMFQPEEQDEVRKKLARARKQFQEIGRQIESGGQLTPTDRTPFPGLCSGPVNWMFRHFMMSDKKFYSTGSCISCGKCAAVCPLKNIRLVQGKPEFLGNCMHCMACIQRCPAHAIEVRQKTEGKARYVCPAEEENGEGGDAAKK